MPKLGCYESAKRMVNVDQIHAYCKYVASLSVVQTRDHNGRL